MWPGLAVAALVGLVYLSVASGGTFRFGLSPYPHHVLVADAWLHGQWHVRAEVLENLAAQFDRGYRATWERVRRAQGAELTEAEWQEIHAREPAPCLRDWSVVDGKYYGYWGPIVPAMLLPYVALAGSHTSDRLFSCVVGTGTVLLTFLMLRQARRSGFVPLTTSVCAALAVLLGLGTVHFFLTVAAQVWFLSEIVATFFATMAIWFFLRSEEGVGWTLAAGAAFGASFLARNSVLPLATFFYIALFAIWKRRSASPWRSIVRHGIAFSLPLIVAGVITLFYNYVRFGNALESGADIQLRTGAHRVFKAEYVRYGLFNLHYVPRNLYYYFVNFRLPRDPATGALTFDPWGNSMFLITPALLYVFGAVRKDWFTVALWIGVVSCLSLLMPYQGSGWYAFGNRYLLDLMPLAILLVAIGMRGRLTPLALLVIALSIAVNAWGTYRFCLYQC